MIFPWAVLDLIQNAPASSRDVMRILEEMLDKKIAESIAGADGIKFRHLALQTIKLLWQKKCVSWGNSDERRGVARVAMRGAHISRSCTLQKWIS